MTNQNRAFDEVKGLLRNLDRSIDDARSRRLGPPESENNGPARQLERGEDVESTEPRPAPAKQPTDAYGDPAPVPGEPPARRRQPGLGRARPLNRDSAEPRQWIGRDQTERVEDDTTIG
ncbi:MAG: hypothetical protein AAFP26_00825 [Planctomycetota bacterium]